MSSHVPECLNTDQYSVEVDQYVCSKLRRGEYWCLPSFRKESDDREQGLCIQVYYTEDVEQFANYDFLMVFDAATCRLTSPLLSCSFAMILVKVAICNALVME